MFPNLTFRLVGVTMPQPPNDEAAKKLCRELCALIRDGEFNALLVRVDDIKSICVDANKDGRTVDQTIIFNLGLDPHQYSLGVAAADPKVEKDSKGYFPVGHRGRIVELLYRCGYSFDPVAVEQIVLADNLEAFEFLVYVRRLGIEHDDPFHSPEMWIAEMCREYVPGVYLPSYLPDDLVKHMHHGNPAWMTIGKPITDDDGKPIVDDDGKPTMDENDSYIWETAQSDRNFSFYDVISCIIDDDSENFPLKIGEWISEEKWIPEKPEQFDSKGKPIVNGRFSTRDLFECAMMSFDGHEYKTDFTGLTEDDDNHRLKEKFYACKGEIRAKLDKVFNANASFRTKRMRQSIRNVQVILDENKQKLSEGDYLTAANSMLDIYKLTKNAVDEEDY